MRPGHEPSRHPQRAQCGAAEPPVLPCSAEPYGAQRPGHAGLRGGRPGQPDVAGARLDTGGAWLRPMAGGRASRGPCVAQVVINLADNSGLFDGQPWMVPSRLHGC